TGLQMPSGPFRPGAAHARHSYVSKPSPSSPAHTLSQGFSLTEIPPRKTTHSLGSTSLFLQQHGDLHMMRRSLLALAALTTFGVAHAQANYPTKPIKLLVPFAAGGTTDLIARVVADPLGRELGQPV